MHSRDKLAAPGFGIGKRVRLHRMLYQHGAGNGTALFLPYDQGMEHGPRDFLANPQSSDPGYVIRLAVDGGFNGIALQIGNARSFFWEFAGEVPLILKLNGKTDIPSDDEPVSPLNATVQDAVELGADAVGYTLYVGSPRQADDIAQFRTVRQDADRYGMPLIVWSYPRGHAIESKGGRNSFYAIEYASRMAAELGADVIKVNWPAGMPAPGVRREYDKEFGPEEMLSAIVRSAGRALVLLSGGEPKQDHDLLGYAETALSAGFTGLIFGRNIWQRDRDESLRIVEDLRKVLQAHG